MRRFIGAPCRVRLLITAAPAGIATVVISVNENLRLVIVVTDFTFPIRFPVLYPPHMPKKLKIRVELTGNAKRLLTDRSKHHAMNQTVMMTRLVEFLLNQDDAMVSVMMSGYPPDVQREVAKLVLAKMGHP